MHYLFFLHVTGFVKMGHIYDGLEHKGAMPIFFHIPGYTFIDLIMLLFIYAQRFYVHIIALSTRLVQKP